MSRRLILGFAASLVVMTGIAVSPARAQSGQEIGRTIAGAVTLFIIGNAIVDTLDGKDKKDKAGSAKAASGRSGPYFAPGATRSGPSWNRGNFQTGRPMRGGGDVQSLKVVPTSCFFTLDRDRRRVGVFGEQCLKDRARRPEWLPRECRQVVRMREGRRVAVYDAQCLRAYGWRAASYQPNGFGRGRDDDDDDHDRKRGRGHD